MAKPDLLRSWCQFIRNRRPLHRSVALILTVLTVLSAGLHLFWLDTSGLHTLSVLLMLDLLAVALSLMVVERAYRHRLLRHERGEGALPVVSSVERPAPVRQEGASPATVELVHDFNNLLMTIGGHAELALFDTPSSSPAAESLRAIVQAVGRAADLTGQLQEAGRRGGPEISLLPAPQRRDRAA